MLERLGLVLGLVVVVTVVALLVRWQARRKVAAVEGQALPAELQSSFQGGRPGIVYFFGPHCGACRQQASILDRLEADQGVAVVRIDAAIETALAGQLAVTTVPATVVIDRKRQVRAVNLGLQSRDVLRVQLGASGVRIGA